MNKTKQISLWIDCILTIFFWANKNSVGRKIINTIEYKLYLLLICRFVFVFGFLYLYLVIEVGHRMIIIYLIIFKTNHFVHWSVHWSKLFYLTLTKKMRYFAQKNVRLPLGIFGHKILINLTVGIKDNKFT